jgi:hypothetical protein
LSARDVPGLLSLAGGDTEADDQEMLTWFAMFCCWLCVRLVHHPASLASFDACTLLSDFLFLDLS